MKTLKNTFSVMLLAFVMFGSINTNAQEKSLKYTQLSELFKTLDKSILKEGSEEQKITYLENFNTEIKDYLITKYPEKFKGFEEVKSSDMTIFHLGLIHAIGEERGFKTFESDKNDLRAEYLAYSWAECAWNVVASYYSIETLYSAYRTMFIEGGTWRSVWPVIKNMARRYAGWYALALLAYEIIDDCF